MSQPPKKLLDQLRDQIQLKHHISLQLVDANKKAKA